MPEAFDPYRKWLGIPPAEQPPNHYRLLAINLFEDDADVIESAADQRMAHVRTFQIGEHSATSQRILNELSAAKLSLLKPSTKAEYDAEMRRRLGPTQPVPQGLPKPVGLSVPPVRSQSPIGIVAEPTSFPGVSADMAAFSNRRPQVRRTQRHLSIFAACAAAMVMTGGAFYSFTINRDSDGAVVQRSRVKKPIEKRRTNRGRQNDVTQSLLSAKKEEENTPRPTDERVEGEQRLRASGSGAPPIVELGSDAQRQPFSPPSTVNKSAEKGTTPQNESPQAAAPAPQERKQAAVALTLGWLARHQFSDGSWSFDHTGGECHGQCSDPGSNTEARFAATGLALLPFLGAGQTHMQGKFKREVQAALTWLTSNMQRTPNGADMTASGSQLSGHAIATIAICEAYAMTHDEQLAGPAQSALNFIMYSQDPISGGWGSSPRQVGEAPGVGWQMMALKSGFLGSLNVEKLTIDRAIEFLNLKQTDGLFHAGDSGNVQTVDSAAGLLCRMYTGWSAGRPELEKGVRLIASIGPDFGNMYFTYFATQFLCQHDGPDGELFQSWNKTLRDSLLTSQASDNHARGSWIFKGSDKSVEQGGRLYCTAMATMALEVYYRYLPLYNKRSVENTFVRTDINRPPRP